MMEFEVCVKDIFKLHISETFLHLTSLLDLYLPPLNMISAVSQL
jgi:hypothetical protein